MARPEEQTWARRATGLGRGSSDQMQGSNSLRDTPRSNMTRTLSRILITMAPAALAVGLAQAEVRTPQETAKREAEERQGRRRSDRRPRGRQGESTSTAWKKEIQLGRQMASEIEKNAKIVDDPLIAEYVNRIGQNIVNNSDAKVPFTIKVIDSDEVNAFALPGGYFYINTGLIELAQDEAELAGVMAHEIAHVAARHGTRNATRGQLIQIASIPLMFIGGWAGYGIQQAANFAIPMTMLKFSPGIREGCRLPRRAVHVQDGLRSGLDGAVLRTPPGEAEEEQECHRESLQFSPDDERTASRPCRRRSTSCFPSSRSTRSRAANSPDVKARLAQLNARTQGPPRRSRPSDTQTERERRANPSGRDRR